MNSNLLIRRVIAIVLTALAVVCLFWPSMMRLGSAYRNMANEALSHAGVFNMNNEIADFAEELVDDLQDIAEDAENPMLFSKFNIYGVYQDLTEIYRTASDYSLSVADLRTVASILMKYTTPLKSLLNGFQKELDEEYSDYFSFSDSSWYTRQAAQLKTYRQYIGLVRFGAIMLNILFFGMLAAGILAIVMMILNKTNLNPIHTVLAFLISGSFLIAIIVLNNKLKPLLTLRMFGYSYGSDYMRSIPDLLVPGVALFLMPIFSLAASILYKRDNAATTARPVFAPDPAPIPVYSPAPQAEAPRRFAEPQPQNNAQPSGSRLHSTIPRQQQQPAFVPSTPVSKPSEDWVCTNCNARNPAHAMFCAFCGGKKPEVPQTKTAFCVYCGKEIDADQPFCAYCGKRQS